MFGFAPAVASAASARQADTVIIKGVNDLVPDSIRRADSAPQIEITQHPETGPLMADSIVRQRPEADSLAANRDTTAGNFLDDVIDGTNSDSLVYDVRNKKAFMFGRGDVYYKDNNLKAEFIEVDMDTKLVTAFGAIDTATNELIRPKFTQGEQTTDIDTVRYNLGTGIAKIRIGFMQEGEGFLIGNEIKKMSDNTINVRDGRYTTCDNTEHPHFYIHMNKAKLETGEKRKIFFGRTSLWMEDVPIPVIIPFGYAPLSTGRRSGWLMPDWGEEYVKGFFIRNGGYYFAFNDYIDMTLTGGFYTLGSWEAAASSRYYKRYKYQGSFNLNFTRDVIGEKDAPDYVAGNNFRVTWTHRQDPKFKPNSNFSASVNYSSSGYSKYGATNMNDRINNQTSSSIAYSKSGFFRGKGSFSTNLSHSQNSSDSTVYLGFPNAVLNVSNFQPFKRGRNSSRVGKERWYEKITMRYTGELKNSVTVKERDLFTQKMWDNMKSGVRHSIPVSASFPVLKHLNISPNFTYNERWYFKRVEKEWDSDRHSLVASDTTKGFYRIYDYSLSMSASTKIYGMFDFGEKFPVQRIRHVMTPSLSFSYSPDFSQTKYGIYREVKDDEGNIRRYSPYEGAAYGIPGTGRSASLRFSLQNTLEAKVRSKKDTAGFRKIKLIDELSLSSSYNFLADSLNLAPFSLTLRVPITKSYSLNLYATLDPYEVNEQGRRINQFMLKRGKIGRITSASWSFDYTFSSKKRNNSDSDNNENRVNENAVTPDAFFSDPTNPNTMLDPATRRRLMSQQYYNFDVPWSFGFSYSFNYSNNGIASSINQTVSFNGSVSLTPKMGINFGAGYDFKYKRLTPGTFTFARDLHCWQMSFSWVPIGYYKSWSFSIAVKSSLLKDLKWDKQSSFYDNLRD